MIKKIMIVINQKDTNTVVKSQAISKLYLVIGIVTLCFIGSIVFNWYQWRERIVVIENLREALIKQDSTLASKLESDKEIERLKKKLIRHSKSSRRIVTPQNENVILLESAIR